MAANKLAGKSTTDGSDRISGHLSNVKTVRDESNESNNGAT